MVARLWSAFPTGGRSDGRATVAVHLLAQWVTLPLTAILLHRGGAGVDACAASGVCGGPACHPVSPPIQCSPASCHPGYSCGHYGCARNRARSALTQKDGIIVPIHEFLNRTMGVSTTTFKSSDGFLSSAPRNNIFGVDREPRARSVVAESASAPGPSEKAAAAETIDFDTYAKLTNPNYLFRQCCEDRRLPDACLSKCNFNAYTQESLQEMFFKSDACPIEAAADMQYCAAQGRDHTACCRRVGIHTTLAAEKCLGFCDQRARRDAVTPLDYSYLPCYERFEPMKRCFYDEIKQRMADHLRPLLIVASDGVGGGDAEPAVGAAGVGAMAVASAAEIRSWGGASGRGGVDVEEKAATPIRIATDRRVMVEGGSDNVESVEPPPSPFRRR